MACIIFLLCIDKQLLLCAFSIMLIHVSIHGHLDCFQYLLFITILLWTFFVKIHAIVYSNPRFLLSAISVVSGELWPEIIKRNFPEKHDSWVLNCSSSWVVWRKLALSWSSLTELWIFSFSQRYLYCAQYHPNNYIVATLTAMMLMTLVVTAPSIRVVTVALRYAIKKV